MAIDLLADSLALAILPAFVLLGRWLPARIIAEDRRSVALYTGAALPALPRLRDELLHLARGHSLAWLGLLAAGWLAAMALTGGGARGLPFACWSAALLTLIRTDLENRLLPDLITQPLLWIGLLLQLDTSTRTVGLEAAVLGAMTGYLPFRLMADFYRELRGVEGMGQGDMKLLAAIGAWWGSGFVIGVYLLATLLALLWRVPLVFLRRSGFGEVFAFGPAIAIAALILAAAQGVWLR